MVSKSGPQQQGRKEKRHTWKFRLQNPGLRAVRASRTFTANEHSIGRWESVLPLAPVTAARNGASGNPQISQRPRPTNNSARGGAPIPDGTPAWVQARLMFSLRTARFAVIFLGMLLVCLAGAHPALCQDQPPDKPDASAAPAP